MNVVVLDAPSLMPRAQTALKPVNPQVSDVAVAASEQSGFRLSDVPGAPDASQFRLPAPCTADQDPAVDGCLPSS